MVPADDEQEHEPTAPQITAGNEPPTASADSTAQLTQMPAWLMHWWTPLAIAGGLLRCTLIVAFFWGGQPHWPSSEAMKLCMTITGAGLAFSAWQQRSHDNITRAEVARAKQEAEKTARETAEKNRRKQIERDEYWKRREHIFHLLDSKNPGLRLGAVALLAELADQAAHSTFLNKIEKQQLQRHIIDTLCLQLRHEGLAHNNEENASDHAQIQAAIFETILKRIDVQRNRSLYADWSKEPINITSCRIHTPILIQNLTTDTTIDFSDSRFLSTFEVNNATITTLLWERAYFIGELSTRNNSVIGIRSLPRFAPYCRYSDTTFVHKSERFIITLTSYKNHKAKPATLLSNCKFISKLTKNASPIEIHTTHNEGNGQKTTAQNLYIFLCQLTDITIDATYINSRIWIAKNSITGRLQIILAETANQPGLLERTPHMSGRIQLQNNVIQPGENGEPIRITNYTGAEITNLLNLDNNHISRPGNFSTLHALECEILANDPKPFKFSEKTPGGRIAHTWRTGGESEDFTTNLGPYLSPFFEND